MLTKKKEKKLSFFDESLTEENQKRISSLAKTLFIGQQNNLVALPSKKEVSAIVEQILHLLFSGYYGKKIYNNAQEIEKSLSQLYQNLYNILLPFVTVCEIKTDATVESSLDLFFKELSQIYQNLWQDAHAIYNEDPAAANVKEVIMAYPGFYAIAVHRIAHVFYQSRVPIFPRMLTEYAHDKTGIDIHPGATIGKSFVIDHGTGVVIGETCVIGDRVKIYQGVTLGALSVEKDMAQQKRHPTIEDDVVIYAGATILGGETCIGRHSVIGGNVWLTQSIPAYSVVYYKSDSQVRTSKELNQVIDFSI